MRTRSGLELRDQVKKMDVVKTIEPTNEEGKGEKKTDREKAEMAGAYENTNKVPKDVRVVKVILRCEDNIGIKYYSTTE